MKRNLVAPFLMCLVFTAVLAAEPGKKPSDGTSHEHAYYTYLEESGPFKLMVYSYPAMWREESSCFPLQIAVGLGKTDKKVALRLANFLLIDAAGKESTPQDYKTVLKEYKDGPGDRDFIKQFPMQIGNAFGEYDQIQAEFYPPTNSPALATDVVELPSATWWTGVIYYANAKVGLDGILTLWLEGKDFQPPIAVKFRVPPAKPRKDQKDHVK